MKTQETAPDPAYTIDSYAGRFPQDGVIEGTFLGQAAYTGKAAKDAAVAALKARGARGEIGFIVVHDVAENQGEHIAFDQPDQQPA